jgi:dienelactone hydrolase
MKCPPHFSLPPLLALLFVVACQSATDEQYEFQSVETTVSSRGVEVPVTYVHPIAAGDDLFPLLVMAHGHGGTRNEAGGFTRVAERLAVQGIASIRMDFPGCGDSVEPFTQNNLSNMLADMQASRDFAISQANIDKNRVGLHGFSMGGRLVFMLSATDASYSVISTWAPAGSNDPGSEVDFLGGRAAYDALKARAAAEGFAPFTTFWGQDQQLSLQWFTDNEESRSLDAIGTFTGPLLILHGDLDEVVVPAVAQAVVAAAANSSEVVHHVVKGAGHGLGLFSDKPALTEEAVNVTVDFLAEHLNKER